MITIFHGSLRFKALDLCVLRQRVDFRFEHSPCAKPLTNTTSWRKRKNSFRTSRGMDKSGQEDCDEWTKMEIRPQERDAWTKLV